MYRWSPGAFRLQEEGPGLYLYFWYLYHDIDGSPMDKEMYESRKGARSNVGGKSILTVS
jgi:hypothetical protein